mgnify:CR=1 FL=1
MKMKRLLPVAKKSSLSDNVSFIIISFCLIFVIVVIVLLAREPTNFKQIILKSTLLLFSILFILFIINRIGRHVVDMKHFTTKVVNERAKSWQSQSNKSSKETVRIVEKLIEKNGALLLRDRTPYTELEQVTRRLSNERVFHDTKREYESKQRVIWNSYIKKKYKITPINYSCDFGNEVPLDRLIYTFFSKYSTPAEEISIWLEEINTQMKKKFDPENPRIYAELAYDGHATTVIIDRQNKTISRWDPHGKFSDKTPDINFISYIVDHEMFNGYKMLIPSDLSDNETGVQPSTHYSDEAGRCVVWMLYFIELSAANPGYSAEEISHKLDEYPVDELTKKIDAYTKWYHGMSHARDNPPDLIKLDEIEAETRESKKSLMESVKARKMERIGEEARKNFKILVRNIPKMSFSDMTKKLEADAIKEKVDTEKRLEREKRKRQKSIDISGFPQEHLDGMPLPLSYPSKVEGTKK